MGHKLNISRVDTGGLLTILTSKTFTMRLSVLACMVVLASCAAPKKFKSKTKAPQASAHVNNKTKFSSALYGVKSSPRVTTSKKVRKGGGRYQVGKPYKIKNKWYYPKEQPGYNKTGMASWYGPNFHGRLTANGEVYDQYALSAAHPTLPLPSYAKVTNLENGNSVIVRINDRGPFSSKRIIDLSAQASKLLGFQKKGLAKVRVRYIGKARMDGRDARYLMASYKPARGQRISPGAPTYSPGATTPGTLLASASMPAPGNVAGNTLALPKPVLSAFSQPQYSSAAIGVSELVPVPLLRPTPLYTGFPLSLVSRAGNFLPPVSPLGYSSRSGPNKRVSQAFQAIATNNGQVRDLRLLWQNSQKAVETK